MNTARSRRGAAALLAVLLALFLNGCKANVDPQTAQALLNAQNAMQDEQPGSEANERDRYEAAGLVPVAAEDPLWEAVEKARPAIAQLLAYKALFPDTFDENAPSADDFWTVTGMGITAVPPEGATDPNHINHVARDVVLDYAAALLPGYEAGDPAPALEDVYGVSGNPRSEIIDIDGLSIGVASSVELLGTDKKDGRTVVRIHIEDKEGLIAKTDWDVLIDVRDDGQEHVLPLIVKTFYPVN